MVYLTAFLIIIFIAYLIIAIGVGIKALIKNNTTDAPEFQLIFALCLGLIWPSKYFTTKGTNHAN